MSEVAKIEQVFEYHGCEELVIAEVLRDDKEAYETGPVEPLIPLAEIGKTTELNKEVRHYVGNITQRKQCPLLYDL